MFDPIENAVTRRDDGQALVEYALVLLLIALVTVAALTSIGVSVSSALFDMANGLCGEIACFACSERARPAAATPRPAWRSSSSHSSCRCF